jgi:hypothetical protein
MWLNSAFVPLSPGQSTMAKGCLTVWNEVLPQLARRGVALVVPPVLTDEEVEAMR